METARVFRLYPKKERPRPAGAGTRPALSVPWGQPQDNLGRYGSLWPGRAKLPGVQRRAGPSSAPASTGYASCVPASPSFPPEREGGREGIGGVPVPQLRTTTSPSLSPVVEKAPDWLLPAEQLPSCASAHREPRPGTFVSRG